MDRMNDSGMISIDLIVAIVLVLAAVMMAILIMPSMSHEDTSWRIKQYMAATRATDNLVQGMGEPYGWEMEWISGNYSNVTKIGFVYVDRDIAEYKVLNLTSINALMKDGYSVIDTNGSETDIRWWEFPSSATSPEERENAAKALGLEGYTFYMQLHPVKLGINDFNSTPLVNNLTDRSKVPINDDTVSVVDRYVYIKNVSSSPWDCNYICYGNPEKTVHYRLNLWVW